MSFGEFIKTPNTVGFWHFNGNANDDSGNGLNGSNVGTVVYSKANGKFNEGAGGFSANSSVIRVEDNVLLDLTTFTISCWFKAAVFSGCLFAKFKGGQSDTNYYLDSAGGSNKLRFIYSPNGSQQVLTVNRSLVANTCYNVVVTAGSGAIKVYINSELISQASYTGTLATNTYPLIFGGRLQATGATYDSYLDGCIDEIFIENRIWSPVDAQKYYTYAKGWF